MLENSLNIQWEVPFPNHLGIFNLPWIPFGLASRSPTTRRMWPPSPWRFSALLIESYEPMDMWLKPLRLACFTQLQHEPGTWCQHFSKEKIIKTVLCHPNSFSPVRLPKVIPCNQSHRPSVPPCKHCRQRSEISLWGHHGCRLNETWCLGRFFWSSKNTESSRAFRLAMCL